MSDTFVLPFEANSDQARADLDTVGGKGQSLARMTVAGFAVPRGFTVTTRAYRQFVAEHGLQEQIVELARPAVVGRTVSYDAASEAIQALFDSAELTDELKAQIASGYDILDHGETPVAVRSSANAEDLPDLSFAGQQDTYLNVRGVDAVTAAVRSCWASLWTARAISYRDENAIDHSAVAMAVVVQVMVPSEVSGILFTANPATGERSEMIVNASFGLGEAIVGGEITPDTFIIDRDSLAVKEALIGGKEHMTVAIDGQGTENRKLTDEERTSASLAESVLADLAKLAVSVEQHFDGVPQDIEWALSADTLSLLQSRPITNLPPTPLVDVSWEKPEMPEWAVPGPLQRKNLVEHIPGPVSPLFEDLYVKDAIASKSLNSVHFAINGYVYWTAGTPASVKLGSGGGRIFPGSRPYGWMKSIMDDPRYKAFQNFGTGKFADTYLRLHRRWQRESVAGYLKTIDHWNAVDPEEATDATLMEGVSALARADGETWYSPNSIGTMIIMNMLRSAEGVFLDFLKEASPDKTFTSGQFLSGLRSIPMEAQEEMANIAEMVKTDSVLSELVLTTPAQYLLPRLRETEGAELVVTMLEKHLDRHGHQVHTLDFSEPTLIEDPLPLMLNLKALVQDTDHDPAAKQIALAQRRQEALKDARETFSEEDWKELREFLWLLVRVYPDRDDALFYVGAAWPTLRRLALELGRRLVRVGTLEQRDDVFYLWRAQLEEAIAANGSGKALPELKNSVYEQRELQAARARLIAPDAVPPEEMQGAGWGKVANDANSKTLNGNACSPGQVTARASLVLSTADFAKMEPGSILVCPMTTPAWTQLFSQAKGLVTDIGGILTHGSIVAREYDIPAVLGLGIATTRIQHGQMISIDGNSGVVTLLDE